MQKMLGTSKTHIVMLMNFNLNPCESLDTESYMGICKGDYLLCINPHVHA